MGYSRDLILSLQLCKLSSFCQCEAQKIAVWPRILTIDIYLGNSEYTLMAVSSTNMAPISDSVQENLKALTFQRLHPRAYLERFIAENIRPDARQFQDRRDITVNVGMDVLILPWSKCEAISTGSISTADGSALVRLGDTTIVCGVKAEIAEPELDSPNDGYLGISLISLYLN